MIIFACVVGVFCASVVQQATPVWVSSDPRVLTEFAMVRDYGNRGLLTHNLLGSFLFEVQKGQEIVVTYDDGTTEGYIVSDIQRFRALSLDDPSGLFVDLQTNETLTASDTFMRVYSGNKRLVLQTCIGDAWGRLFVIAAPIDNHYMIAK